MRGRKYFWENDYKDGSPEDYMQKRNVLLHPAKAVLETLAFSDAIIEPILNVIAFALANKEHLVIIGDYDMDGTSATAILVKALGRLGADVDYYIPNRFTHGYGIHPGIVERFHAEGATCLITVDNGIKAYEAATRARELGLTLIITDHHLPGKTLPDAAYILHPALDEGFKGIEICGAGVAYLLAQKLLSSQPNVSDLQADLLQLAALGTIGDMMPLDQPWNRALSYHGFTHMQQQPILLLKAFSQLRELKHLTSDDLSFHFIPCINAVGRIADGNVVVEAFLSTTEALAVAAMDSFDAYNIERKTLTDKIYQAILKTLPESAYTSSGFLFIVGEDWHQGVLGIVAQRLMQHVSRPIILLTNSKDDETIYTGSARAYGAYSVEACFNAVADLLLNSGGHQYAGGLKVAAEQILELRVALEVYNDELAKEMQEHAQMMPLVIDAWLSLSEINDLVLQRQDQFAPHGTNNKKFVIGVKQVKVAQIQELGTAGLHLKLNVIDDYKHYQIVGFGMFELSDELAKYAVVDLAIEANRHYFKGVEHIQYRLIDIRLPQKQIFDWRQRKYQGQLIPATRHAFIIKEIPLDSAAFFAALKQKNIAKIYLLPIPYEEHLLYAQTIEQQYFVFIYKYLKQKQTIDLQDEHVYYELAQKKIPKSIFLYILRVFFELNFVIIESNICRIKVAAQKTSLTSSPSYQQMASWLALRSTLLTGTIDTLYETLTTQ